MPISFDSTSKTYTYTPTSTANSDAGSVSQNFTLFGRSRVVQGDEIKIDGNRNNVVINSLDGEVVAASNKLVSDIISKQAGLTRDAVQGYGKLAETKITDGANLTVKSTNIAIIAIAGVGLMIALVVWLKR